MFDVAKLVSNRNLFANFLFAGSVFLCATGNAFAAANLTTSSASFISADPARANSYMDAGGVWNGLTEVSNVGDTFTLTIANTAVGSIPLDSAFDLQDVTVTVDAGFSLAANTLNINNIVGLPACPNISVGNAQQPGGAGNPITLNIGANEDVRPGCLYELSFGLMTTTAVAAGAHPVSYAITYTDDGGTTVNLPDVVQNIDVNTGAILLAKTTTEFNPLNGVPVDFNVNIQNPGLGGLFDVSLTDLLGTGFDLASLTITPLAGAPAGSSISLTEYRFSYVEPGANFDVRVRATTDFPLASTTCPTLSNTASIIDRTSIVVPDSSASIPFNLGALSVTHINTSRCVLCGTGTVTLRLTNASGVDVNNLVITEDLLASELMIINGTSTFGGAPIANPSPSGTQYTWTLPAQTVPANSSVDLVFDVAYDTVNFGINEDLARNNTTISASVDYELSCGVTQPPVSSGNFLLTLNQPLPQVTKLVRNVDAAQAAYAATTFGHRDDDVIWQVSVQNTGPINMQDVVLDDAVTGNFIINYVCPDVAAADLAAAGTAPASCFSTGGVTSVNNFEMNDPFGAPGPDDVLAGTTENVYYVGKVTTDCGVETNNNNIEWGCDIDGTLGGLNSASIFAGGTVDNANASLSTEGNGAISAASVTHTVRGVDGGVEVGSRGIVTITVVNDTGGTIRDVVIDDVLPTSYVVDNTAPITFAFNPAYGVYGGQSDQMAHNVDLTPANLLTNIAPQFVLTSDDTGDNPVVDVNLFRNGDSFTITFQIVLIDPVRYDLVADLDLAQEVAPGTDPVSTFTINNDLTITYDDTCTFTAGQSYNETPGFPVDVEDLDVSISDALFILTNDPGTQLDLNVDLTNNGGHVADNYIAYITLGQAMTAQLPLPNGCAGPVVNPPPHPHWDDPSAIPLSAAVYACDRGSVAPGVTERITFSVIKAAGAVDDDLTFRADVFGEITLFDNTALTLPAPAPIPDTTPNVQQLANNYSFDAIRSRVLGFNLVKSAWYCAEDGFSQPVTPPADILSPAPGAPNTPALTGNLNSQIGEDCAYRIESGGWFGFITPGFALIKVQDVTVTDDLPDGQGFIPFGGSNYSYTSAPGIILNGADGGAGSIPLDETDISWNFNTGVDGISVADKFFRVDFKTRLLNDPVDLAYPVPGGYAPNLHGNLSTNIARSSFTAVFQSDPIAGVVQPPISINVSDTVNSPAGYIVPPGYPAEPVRRVDLTDVEPNILVTKQVCNEDLNGFGTGCSIFADSINNGDTNDSYIYRITLENQTSAPVRSPAFNIISTDTLDASDLMLVVDFAGDGLDNDGDTQVDEADEAVLFASIPDNIVGNGTPAVITVNEIFNTLLLQVDPGPANRIEFYYRVDPDITIAPLQTLTNTVSMSYDSLDAAFGNQNDPKIPNADPRTSGRARIYTTIAQTADVQMIPVIALPKLTVATANTPATSPQNVSVGEEVRYLLVADLPVANLRKFRIRDELPAGVSCVQLQDINLSQGIYAAAGFVPGGPPLSTTCSGQVAEWFFGDQAVTNGVPGARFNFPITFVARVDNVGANTEAVTLTNGGVAIDDPIACTSVGGGGVGVCYENDFFVGVSLDFAPVDVVVREPVIALTKSFLPVTNSDAADILTVTVTATNTGTAAAYNLQVLDDLVGSDMTYIIGSEGGPNQPDSVDTSVPNRPIFSWTPPPVPPAVVPPQSPDYEILPLAVKTFTFQVRVDTTAQPLEILENTIEAKWDSLPDRFTVLNTLLFPAPSTTGPDGSATGLRNGAVPNAGDLINDYEITATASTSVLPLTMTKTDLDAGIVVPTIGAHRNFEVVIDLPEGTTENLIVNDNLISSGISYVLRRDGAALFDVKYTFQDIVSINGQPPAEAEFRGATAGPSTLPVDGDSGAIVWDIGQVITEEEDDLDGNPNIVNPRIIINYFARPNNDLATQNGVDLQNSATTTYDNGETAATETLTSTPAAQTVVEPLLAISKAVTNFTNSGVGPVAGDVLEYVVTIDNNAGTSTAFDSNIVDTLDDNLLFDASVAATPTAFLDGNPVPLFVASPIITAAPSSTLTWGRLNADNTLDIPVGSTLVLTYRAVVQNSIEPNVIINNSVIVDWTSLDDADPSSAFERTGLDCLAAVAGVNDYCTAPFVANITALDSNSIVKTVIFDTYNEPPLSDATDSIVRVGDTATYRLEINIQQGTTESVNILDAIPLGMEFVDVVSINGVPEVAGLYAPPVAGAGSNFSYAPIPAANVPSAGDRLIFNWSLGNIINDFAGDATTDSLVIEYSARVFENDPATIAQNPTTTLTNSADFTYIDGNGNPSPGDARLNDTADLIVLQPEMDALSKTDRLGRLSPLAVNVATDVMQFRLHSCNTTGLARAYGLLITDTLPTQMNEATIFGPANGALLMPDVLIDGVLATEGVGNDYVYTAPLARGGDMVFQFNTPIDPGSCVDIDFNMGFYTDFAASAWSNTLVMNEYYSLPPANAQLYPAVGPVTYDMNNLGAMIPSLPEKTMVTPVPVLALGEATIGDEVVYQILVPQTPFGAVMYDVNITDILNNRLMYVSASDIGPSGFSITDNTVLPFVPGGTVDLVINQIPAGQQAIIELRARVDNNLNANNDGSSFANTVSYVYANVPTGVPVAGGSDTAASALTVIEPFVAVGKTVANITQPTLPPDAGDILRYSVTLTASGGAVPGDLFSDAFDMSIDDTLSLGMLYIDGTETVNGGNTINLPVKVGDGITTPQTLSWSLTQANADIDVTEGTVVTVNYDVLVLDSVLANQNLSNSVDIQWSSRDGPDVPGGTGEFQRDGSGIPPLNDYFNLITATTLQTTLDSNIITKSRLSDTFNPADNIVRIGDIVEYELRINMQEGTSPNFIVQDTLPEGLIFEQTVSINGQTVAPNAAVAPFSHAAIPAAVVAGDPVTGPTTVTWSAGDVINAGDNDISNDDFVIVYRARVLNLALPQLPTSSPLTNNVTFDYAMASGAAPTKTSSQQLELRQPELLVTKTSLPVAGSVIDAGDVVTYTVEITNNGDSPAYDTELLDIIPLGLRSPAITMVSMSLASGAPLPAVPLAPVYDPVTGTANWNFDTGTADEYSIPALDTLQIVYQVQADVGLGAGMTLTNSAQVQFYYSFDNDAPPLLAGINGVREIYGPSNLAQVTLTTTPANPLLKINPTDLDASIGETFTYRITVPETPQATALYDVQILDNLTASDADLQFDRVDPVGTPPWVPVNIGTLPDNLIIADVTNGIDIPAGGQIAVDVTVTLRNIIPPNTAALPSFSNAATYTFNQVDGDNGTVSNGPGNTTPLMNIVEPDLTLVKTGPVGTVNFTAPIPYILEVENIGNGPAFDTTIVDQLPDVPDNPPLTGGTCDALPVIIDANVFANDGTTLNRALVQDTDYIATHTAAPTCELVITTITDTARIEATEKLIVRYETTLDVATQSGALLTNTAGATRWFSLDTAGAGATDEIREYTSVLTSSATVTVEAPVLDVQKTVFNVSTVLPGDNAIPGEILRYTIVINNSGLIDANAVTLSDAVPVNATYIADTTTLNGLPVGQPDGGVSPLVTGIDVSSSELPPPTPGNGSITVGETATITFDVLLDAVITSGTVITNQAIADSPSTGPLPSDDPNIGGTADPTPTLITSAPAFLVEKISQDITGDPAILEAGDTLRYTLTVKNIGQENALNSLLSDQIPANTTYVADTVTLNGLPVGRPDNGVSPLAAGISINAPEDTTTGFLRADTDAAANNVATITFDVVVNMTAVNGTLISNQGFFNGNGAGSGVFPQQPSDDPGTALPDDPTIDVVGNVPVVDSLKTVAIQDDVNGNGLVDPGDTLRYTITTTNIGAMPATNVVLTDTVPVETTYDAGSGLLDGLPAGVSFAGSILTVTIGDLLPANSAIVIFDVVVNAGVLAGTIISNQGSVASNELPDELTDADGNDANGDQPTIIVVGNVQQLAITKQVTVIGGGAAEAGKTLEYVVRVSNIGSIAAENVVITDVLDPSVMTYLPGSGRLGGLVTGVAFDDITLPSSPTLTADYSANYGDLPAAAVTELRFRVSLDASLNIGETVSNTAEVTWNTGTETATVSIDIGGTPGSANINGQAWHDTDFNNVAGAGEALLQDYRVELYRNNTLLANTLTDVNGVFQFTGLPPVLPSDDLYELRYLAPGATAATATLGTTNSTFINGAQRITGIVAASGTIVQGLNLPRQVNGIVYDSVLRVPVAGVQLSMINQSKSNQPVPAECFADASHANQVTQADGYYKFDLNFSDSSRCAENDEYVIQIQPPASGYIGTTSVIIPPLEPITGNALDVANCPGNLPADKIPATAEHCENSVSDVPAPGTVEPRAAETDYNLKFLFDGLPVPQLPPPAPLIRETNQIFNNHIPVDSELGAAVSISKVAGKLNVTRSDLVPYTITFNNTLGVPLFDISIIDNFPAGFKYVTGSARVDGEEIEPQINGQYLTWPGLSVNINESRVIKLLLIVGSGVGEGEYVNTARVINTLTGGDVSGVASATVRVIPDPTFDCTDIIGKVYEDSNLNAYQDKGERGIPGVQVATARGLRVTTDAHGRFHITCAIVANEVRGSNFIMKLDDRTLPSGYRVTTENPRVQRATRGKMLKFNFGTAIHRVVRVDLADGVFEKGSTELRPQWESRIELLITELQKEGSILRLSYLGENESEDEVENRLDAIEELISDRWQELDCCYRLTIEKEVFWRKGKPSDRMGFE